MGLRGSPAAPALGEQSLWSRAEGVAAGSARTSGRMRLLQEQHRGPCPASTQVCGHASLGTDRDVLTSFPSAWSLLPRGPRGRDSSQGGPCSGHGVSQA